MSTEVSTSVLFLCEQKPIKFKYDITLKFINTIYNL